MSKIIVITGGGSGLGRAMAKRFAHADAQVVLLGRTESKLQETAAMLGPRADYCVCDVRDPNSIREAFAQIEKKHERIDVLINNAAVFEHALLSASSQQAIIDTIATDLTGPILCSQAALPLMRAGGHIFNISSGAADSSFPALSVYSAAKAGLERFALSLYDELQPLGIRVTVVRTGQMMEAETDWDLDPQVARLAAIAMEHGVDARKRPTATFTSVADAIFRLADLPGDLASPLIVLRPRLRARDF